MQAAFYGVGATVIGIITIAAYKLAKLTMAKDKLQWVIFAVMAVVTAWTESEILWLFLLCGVAAMVAQAPPAWLKRAGRRPASWSRRRPTSSPRSCGSSPRRARSSSAAAWPSCPFLYGGVVQEYGWLNDKQFLDAVAVAMLTPGPIVITVAFIGYLVAAFPGAVAAAVGVFLPVYLFVVIPFPWFDRISGNPKVKAFVAGVTAAASGTIAGACFVLARRAIFDVPTLADRRRGAGGGMAIQGPGTRAHRGRRRGGPHHLRPAIGETTMKWVTRERARVDRIACPWLITRFIDPTAGVPVRPGQGGPRGGRREKAIPYDIPNVELGHHGALCSFDAFIDRYELTDPGLTTLAAIVRGADTDDRGLTPESAGLYAAATGFQATSRDDFDNMSRQFPMYDALYEFSRMQAATVPLQSRVLFVCLHGAAKSVVAAAHFRRLAAARGLAIGAVAAGTEPDAELGAGGGEGSGRAKGSRRRRPGRAR